MTKPSTEPYVARSFIVDPDKVKARSERRGAETVWHHELVGARLIEAAATVRRMPMRTRPKEFGTIWPSYNPMTYSDLVAFKNELMQSGGQAAVSAWERDQNRVRIPPSGQEIERAEEALGWVPKYLGSDTETAKVVGFWASKTYDLEDDIPVPVRTGLRVISRGLRADKIPVRT